MVHGDALALVDGGRIAVVDLGIVLQVEPHLAAIGAIEAHGEAGSVDLFDGPERAVFHAHGSLVAQEHHAVAWGERPLSLLRPQNPVLAVERAGVAHPAACELIQLRHVGPGVGEHDLAGFRPGLAHGIPAVHEGAAGGFAGLVTPDHAGGLVAVQGSAGSARGQLPRRLPLPVLALAPDFGDLGRAMTLSERPERGAGLDGLELLGVADQHHLGASGVGRRQHPLHLARPDHPGLVDHQHVTRGEHVPALRPAVLETGDRPRADARTALQAFRGDPG